jgi:hypothetical protein
LLQTSGFWVLFELSELASSRSEAFWTRQLVRNTFG